MSWAVGYLTGKSKRLVGPQFIAYRLVCKTSGRCYIGVTHRSLKERWGEHIYASIGPRKNTILSRAIRKYGADSFIMEPLCCCQDWDALLSVERALIQQHKTLSPLGYNLTLGGEGIKGYVYDRVLVERLTAARRGRPFSEEVKARIRIARSKLPRRNQTASAKAAISAAHRGKVLTFEHRAKLAAAKLGKKMPPRSAEHAAHLNASLRNAWKRRFESGYDDSAAASKRSRALWDSLTQEQRK